MLFSIDDRLVYANARSSLILGSPQVTTLGISYASFM